MISQILQIFSEAFKAVSTAFFELLPLANGLSNLRTEMIAAIFGIPSLSVFILSLFIRILKFLIKNN